MRIIRWLPNRLCCPSAGLRRVAFHFLLAIHGRRTARNATAISSRVDFPAVRASLKKQLVARFANRTNSPKRWSNLGPTLIDAIIDAYVTPEGIAALLSNPEALKNLKAPREFHFEFSKTKLVEGKIRILHGTAQFCRRSGWNQAEVPLHSLRLATSRPRPRFDRHEALIRDFALKRSRWTALGLLTRG